MIGKTLAHYEILEKIGQGGMGEVYRARDTKLGREVALKLLPVDVAGSPERVARFEREARTLASLHHPNIASIFGFEEAEGHRFLTMELVEGEDLAARLRRGPLPIEDAVEVARQIAEGVEEAHSKGIVHRDLKPANVKLTPQGKVKVLDFGLARALLGSDSDSGELDRSPTITAGMTQAGAILGTAAYMSPEQARGKAADSRSDVWSFGCVLYEMLAGARSFPGESLPESLGAIIHKEPDWNGLPNATPPALGKLLRRCLTKDVKQRLQAIGDARVELQEIQKGPPGESLAPTRAPAASPWLRLMVALLSGIVIGVIAMLWARPATEPSRPGPVASPTTKKLTLTFPADAPLATGSFHCPFRFSPDGKTLAYVSVHEGRTRLNLRALDSDEIVPLEGTEGGEAPFFSPDGEWLGFYANLKLKKVSLRGGAARDIANLEGMRGAAWGQNDSIVLTTSTIDSLYTVPASGERPEPLTQVDAASGDTSHRFPLWLPGGRSVVFGILKGADYAASRIATVELEGGAIRDLVQGSVDPRYSPTGHLLFVEFGSLTAVDLDPRTVTTTGQKMPLVHDVMWQNNTGAGYYDLSADGTLAYVEGGEIGGGFSLISVDREGEATPLTTKTGTSRWPRLSPSGKRFTISMYEQSTWDILIGDVDSGILNKVTFEHDNVGGVWTPDEQYLIFSSAREGPWNLWRVRTDGSGGVERLSESRRREFATDVSPDGRYVVYSIQTPETGNDVMLLDTAAGNKSIPYLRRPADEGGARVSPDGKWAVYATDETGQWEVFLTAFPEPEGRWQISSDGGNQPVWSRDGRRIYYRDGDRLIEATLSTEPRVIVERTRFLFEGWYEGLLGQSDYANFDVSPDGSRFLMLRGEGSATHELRIITDFFSVLRTPDDAIR